MFIKKLHVKNFRLFEASKDFVVDSINIPNSVDEGSGITVLLGENSCGKTTLLDALALPLLSYKADSFSVNDLNDPSKKAVIQIFSAQDFEFDGTMPKVKYKGKGFCFEAGLRSRDTKNYLSSIIVSDQKYIRADGEIKPEDGKPDLRMSVNNPWKGSRFSENDILFLDKSRTYQIRSGIYNTTKFDRLMEDFDLQYLKKDGCPLDLCEVLKHASEDVENSFFKNAVDKFQELSGETLRFNLINNYRPHSKAFFSVQKPNHQQIPLDMLGSGYEMIFSLLYSFYLAQQSGKQLILLIDEPELHLHPELQERFVKLLLEFSKTTQIILSTHSSLLIKQLFYNENVKANILSKLNGATQLLPIGERLLPFVSANELNYLAFGLPTEEYHNELYEELKLKDDNSRTSPLNIKDFDLHFFQKSKHEPPSYPYKEVAGQVSLHTYLRNQIHHRATAGRPDIIEMKKSIEAMRNFF